MAGLSGQPVLLSFNPPRLFQVHPDSDEFVSQGGVTPLPLSLDDPLLKGAVNPVDGLLYLTGFNIWGTKAKEKPFSVGSGPTLKKFCPLRSTFVPESVESFCVSPALSTPSPPCKGCLFPCAAWNYKRTSKYGSPNYKLDGSPGSEDLPVSSIKLSRDKKTVFVGIPDMREVMQMEVSFDLAAQDRSPIKNKSFLTVHLLRKLSLKGEGFADDQVDLTVDGQAIVELPFEPTLEKGKDLYGQLGCIGCHSVDGSREGEPVRVGWVCSDPSETSHRGNGDRRRGLLEGVHPQPCGQGCRGLSTGKRACPFTRAFSTRSKSNRSSFMRARLVAERIRVLHFSWLVAFDYSQ